MVLTSSQSYLVTANILKWSVFFVFKVRNVSSVTKMKKHSKLSDVIRLSKLAQHIQDIIIYDLSKFMKVIANQFKLAESTLRHVVHEDIRDTHVEEWVLHVQQDSRSK